MIYTLETVLCLACVGATWAWLFTPDRKFGDRTLTAALIIAGLIVGLEIIKYGSLPG